MKQWTYLNWYDFSEGITRLYTEYAGGGRINDEVYKNMANNFIEVYESFERDNPVFADAQDVAQNFIANGIVLICKLSEMFSAQQYFKIY